MIDDVGSLFLLEFDTDGVLIEGTDLVYKIFPNDAMPTDTIGYGISLSILGDIDKNGIQDLAVGCRGMRNSDLKH